MLIIRDTEALSALCDRLRREPYITVDTEFLREKTYWPILCLIQAAGQEDQAIIDPLAEGIDLAPLFELMADPAVLKVFHAARQDLEIFFHLAGAVPAPIFDTQIAAMVCGFGESVGYETLVREIMGAQLDKSSRFTDWSKRPLTDKQLNYALSDVTHLRGIYERLAKDLEDAGRAGWLTEEMAVLEARETYVTEPEDAWKRLKLRNIKPKSLGTAIAVAAWREREAQTRDIPRGRVLKDDGIYELAQQAPRSHEDLSRLRGAPRGLANSKPGERLIAAIAEGLATPRENLPKIERGGRTAAPPQGVVELLKVLLKAECERHNVATKMVASAADIEALALSDTADIPALAGWRREIFGEAALRLKRGELSLRIKNGEIEIEGDESARRVAPNLTE
ncbi:MAG: ribonuclease D [Pseudomonadota bacterium]